MTMNFRLVKTGIEGILSNYASTGGYRVLGYNDDAIDAEDLLGTRRLVQVYADGGDFNGGGFNGPAKHDVTFAIDLLTSAKAQVDLTVIDDETSTAVEIAAAMAAAQAASKLANDDLDEFIDVIFNLLMDNTNLNMGVSELVASVGNRWIPKWKKSKPMTRGDMVVLHATMDLTCRVMEDFAGVTPVAATEGEAVKTIFKLKTDEDAELDDGLAASQAGG